MAKTISRFGFDLIGGSDSKPIPSNPIIRIRLERYTKQEEGSPVISPHLMSEAEIDNYIQQLKDDLDNVARLAKKALRQHDHPQVEIT